VFDSHGRASTLRISQAHGCSLSVRLIATRGSSM
jgi:hypothetical protein